MSLQNLFVGILAGLALALGALAYFDKSASLGGFPGPEVYEEMFFRAGATTGGEVLALTDANGGTYTMTASELKRASQLRFVAGGAGQAVIALQLPATSTMSAVVPKPGDCRTYLYDASALAAATTTTITAGAGMDLIAYTTNDDVIDGNEFAFITMCRQADSDVTVYTTELLHAD